MSRFVDKQLSESQAEKTFRDQFTEIYLTWDQTTESFNKLVGFGISLEPEDRQDQGFAIFPSQSEGYRLSKMFESRVRNQAWRISSIQWQGGSAVSESILRPDMLVDVIKSSHFDGTKFYRPLPSHLDPWRTIAMETLTELNFSKLADKFQ